MSNDYYGSYEDYDEEFNSDHLSSTEELLASGEMRIVHQDTEESSAGSVGMFIAAIVCIVAIFVVMPWAILHI